MTPKEAADLRRLISEMAGALMPGLRPDDVTPEQMQDMLRAMGLPVDGEGVAELERSWLEMQPVFLQAAVDPAARAYLKAESVFQAAVDELGQRPLLEGLAAFTPGVRAIVATRFVEANVGNGGWVSVFVEGQGDLLPIAIEGYRTLGLADHGRLAQEGLEIFTAAAGDIGESRWDDLDVRWLDLEDAELGRAAYIGANGPEFVRFQ